MVSLPGIASELGKISVSELRELLTEHVAGGIRS